MESDGPLTITARLKARRQKHIARRRKVISRLRQRQKERNKKLLVVVICATNHKGGGDIKVVNSPDESVDTNALAKNLDAFGFTAASPATSTKEQDSTFPALSPPKPSQTQHYAKPPHTPNTPPTFSEQRYFPRADYLATDEILLQEAEANALRRKRIREACDAFEREYRVPADDPSVLMRMRSINPECDDDGEWAGVMRVQRPFDEEYDGGDES